MNWQLFLESMHDYELDDLYTKLVKETSRRRQLRVPQMPELNDDEKRGLTINSRLPSIHKYRNRTNCTLIEARDKIDEYLKNT